MQDLRATAGGVLAAQQLAYMMLVQALRTHLAGGSPNASGKLQGKSGSVRLWAETAACEQGFSNSGHRFSGKVHITEPKRSRWPSEI